MTKQRNASDAYHPRTTYISAREEARRRGDRKVGTDHLDRAATRDRLSEPPAPAA